MNQPANADAPSNELRQWLASEAHHLRECTEISANYHGKRERFLLLCERICQAVAALTATAAFSQMTGPTTEAAKWFALAAAVASVLPLVFGFAAQANRHAALSADHKRLRSQLAAAGHNITEAEFDAMRARFHEIEAGEPASLGALVVQCQNEIAVAKGHASQVVPLRWYHRGLMHVWDFHIQPPRVG